MSKTYNANTMHRMCLRKKRYRTWDYAQEVAKYMTKKYGKEQRAYYCPICHSYHLTSQCNCDTIKE